jgi:hypothetical protein
MHNNHNNSPNTNNSGRRDGLNVRNLALGGTAFLAAGGLIGGAWKASIDSKASAPASTYQTGILSPNRIPSGVEVDITLKDKGEVWPAVRNIYEAFGQNVDDSFVDDVSSNLIANDTAANNQAPGATYRVWVDPGHQVNSETLTALNKEFPQELITINQTPEAK